MITKMRPRYYCEYCKKSGGSKYHMKIHEKHCTMNPDRECRVCLHANGGDGNDIEKLKAAIAKDVAVVPSNIYTGPGVANLREVADNCPVCMLAGIRQYNKEFNPGFPMHFDWDYKTELAEIWTEINNNNRMYYHDE